MVKSKTEQFLCVYLEFSLRFFMFVEHMNDGDMSADIQFLIRKECFPLR